MKRLSLIVAFLSTVNSSGNSAIALVQHAVATQSAGATSTIPISASGSGNAICVLVASCNTPTITSVTDDASGGSNTYAQYSSGKQASVGAGTSTDIWCAFNTNSGATTITIHWSPVNCGGDAFAYEYSGVALTSAFDTAAGLVSSSQSSPMPGASLTNSNAGSVLIEVIAPQQGVISVSSPWDTNALIGANFNAAADYKPGAIGTYNANFTDNNLPSFYASSGVALLPFVSATLKQSSWLSFQ